MSKEDMSVSKAILYTLLIAACIPVGWGLRAWMLADLWSWFIVPLPFGIPALSKAHALGLSFVVAAIIHRPNVDGIEKLQKHAGCDWTADEKMWRLVGLCAGAPIAMWCIGWCGHAFIGWWWA